MTSPSLDGCDGSSIFDLRSFDLRSDGKPSDFTSNYPGEVATLAGNDPGDVAIQASSPATTLVMSPRQKFYSASMMLKKNFPDMDKHERLHHAGRHVREDPEEIAFLLARMAQARPELDPTVKELMVTNLTNITD